MCLESIAKDPKNRVVYFPDGLRFGGHEPDVLHDKVGQMAKVVETPECIIEMPDDRVFYFRSIEYNCMVMMEAACQQGRWVAVTFQANPSADYIQSLLKQGNFIPGVSIGQSL